MVTVHRLDEGLALIDLHFQGQPGVIGAYLIEDAGETALIEIGPGSTLETLLEGLREAGVAPQEISKILVTHIHLDHAGAAGSFIRRYPHAQLYVHENGAPHMVDPERLLASATRIYGDMMGPLWGEFLPVPEENVHVLTDGETIAVGNRTLTEYFTPGHASHHVIYHDADRGQVFTGDVAAVRLQGYGYVRPPTPPPDLDLEAWGESIERIRGLGPSSLYLTHFGPFTDVDRHLREASGRLLAWADVVRHAVEIGQDRPAIVDNLTLRGDAEILQESRDAEAIRRYELATPYGMTVDGYLRYLRKREQAR
jgi:glyoxylase-like metal-dependent hydrolase (beta-lactamase superfamily II)